MSPIPASPASGTPSASPATADLILPVGARCLAACAGCTRKKPCPGFFRPSATEGLPKALDANAACAALETLAEQGADPLRVILAGPGDALSTQTVLEPCATLARELFPAANVVVAGTPLGAAPAAEVLSDLADEVWLLAGGTDPDTALRAHPWVRLAGRVQSGPEAGEALVEHLRVAVQALTGRGVPVRVVVRVLPAVNLDQIPEIAASLADWAPAQGVLDLILVFDPTITPEQRQAALAAAANHLPTSELSPEHMLDFDQAMAELPEPDEDEPSLGGGLSARVDPQRPRVAVATTDGYHVNAHLGQARKLLIYEQAGGHGRMVGVRETPPAGENRWDELAALLADCSMILVAEAGDRPRQILGSHGIRVLAVPQDGGTLDDYVAHVLGLADKRGRK